MVNTKYIQLQARGNTDILDISSQVTAAVRESGINDGTVTIFCPSSTSSVTTIEFESGCLQDLTRLFEEMVSSTGDYAHNYRWGDGNGHSHLRASLLGPSITIPIIERQLCLGTWQQVIFIDFDVRARSRRIVLQIMGD